jgi:hypothetical protein
MIGALEGEKPFGTLGAVVYTDHLTERQKGIGRSVDHQ